MIYYSMRKIKVVYDYVPSHSWLYSVSCPKTKNYTRAEDCNFCRYNRTDINWSNDDIICSYVSLKDKLELIKGLK